MALGNVAELARQAANQQSVLNALRNDPTRISKPLNLSEAHLRALISAGSFTTARPVVTTSVSGQSLASQIASMDLGTLFPPEGEGQLPTPGELPPVIASPQSSPVVAPVQAVPPGSTPSPGGSQTPQPSAPIKSAPQSTGTPTTTPAPKGASGPQAPTAAPGSGRTSSAPVATTGTPQAGNATPSSSGQTSSSGTSGGSGQEPQQPEGQTPGGSQSPGNVTGSVFQRTPAVGCCTCLTAMVSVDAAVSTTAQAAITAITAIAGLG